MGVGPCRIFCHDFSTFSCSARGSAFGKAVALFCTASLSPPHKRCSVLVLKGSKNQQEILLSQIIQENLFHILEFDCGQFNFFQIIWCQTLQQGVIIGLFVVGLFWFGLLILLELFLVGWAFFLHLFGVFSLLFVLVFRDLLTMMVVVRFI